MMQRSILALVALVAFAISSSAAFACPAHQMVSTPPKQTVASVDGGVTPIPVPTEDDDG
jgi:hypothetical protein